MSNAARLFSPVSIGALELRNRIVVSPMCQYSAAAGSASDWHLAHLGSLALSGAGLLFVEATAVNPEGRITPACLGLYSDDNEVSLARAVAVVRQVSDIAFAIQLAHAGRKASSARPWEGGKLIEPAAGGWQPVAPSAIALYAHEAPPRALDEDGLQHVEASFADAARRTKRLGFQAIELHMAHGYLLHEFLSPLTNRRVDQYGGTLENRMRFPLRVLAAVQREAGADIPVGVRISASDWIAGGWDIEQSVVLCQRLQEAGCEFVDVSSGGLSPEQDIQPGPGYQVPFAERIKREISIPVISVGLITEPHQAEEIIASGQADMVALARGMLNDPRWPWRAAAELGATVTAPAQYWRCLPQGHPRVFGDTPTGQR
ncbi:MAG: NADH:flavin oxidoreductase/NADH oxidase [Gammaproteobacteria bacterium]|nr:NADH:flavin oxidoreductase/NADH oxidase [Gammaproteobacteria bacterium]